MFKKFLVTLLVFSSQFLFAEENFLPFYKETTHFQAFCFEEDKETTDEILQVLEAFWNNWENDFSTINSNYFFSDEKISVFIYPNVETFHQFFLKNTFAPNWMIGWEGSDNQISMVSANNPGPEHTKESILNLCKVCLSHIFLQNYYYQYNHLCDYLDIFEDYSRRT
ncbi:MAG: hypothetical protein KR126chlam5_01115 [Candidatus Anoxychlamydiales bacterium]|nr:hypothetical protein [Candidatus Anoxychlamydiales bacterium]